ncbi:ABC transporter ATP-binding protein [Nocardioides panzhihuensis]|uniref:ABC-type quaternary amine transporter n=1 Tax=Nocardioides panzhihuensis TaxID=860243 RepID=A0A7Z0IRN9_9ACTN|nr:betaine/proline/choline family ABC transporter ATP-binding protein [Nocardioides panzhihuensis]NYI76998.1 osmoprotectant transport system ATP-binding protein [Nocardioides panzhihuensis]
MSENTPMIRLRQVCKRYPGTAADAVRPLDLEINRGEFVVLVGPSGCGKTTTLRMINRLVEPTSGEIWIDGQDVTHTDPDEMRRHIGYVIQQVGLIPHMTIAQNVGLVPKMLGWDKTRIRERAEELLELVGLEPAKYAKRYPKQLSGGQQQRVGVARALAADPPVMLMDEPFGAIDPVTRDRLQREFLRLQSQIKKTIVFVTHDIDEAVKLGDRIAIFAEGSRLAQFATPLEILTNPADDFVRSFIGEGAGLRRLGLLRMADLAAERSEVTSVPGAGRDVLEVQNDDTVAQALDRAMLAGATHVVVPGGRPVAVQDLVMAGTNSRTAGAPLIGEGVPE